MSGIGNADFYVSTYRQKDSGRWQWEVTSKGKVLGYVTTDTKSTSDALLLAMEEFA